jgi:hypothetical protein
MKRTSHLKSGDLKSGHPVIGILMKNLPEKQDFQFPSALTGVK